MEQPRKNPPNRDRWDMDRVRYHLDNPPPPMRDIKTVGEVLRDVVGAMEEPVQDNVRLLRDSWPKLAGEQIASHSRPSFIKDFVLHVGVDHPGWLAELERMKRPLLLKLQSAYRELGIRQLRFFLGSF